MTRDGQSKNSARDFNVIYTFPENNIEQTKIETARTIIRPIKMEDQFFIWKELYGNRETMKFYHDRIPRTLKRVSSDVIGWNDLFLQGIPYSAYVVISKDSSSQKIGLIVIEARQEHDAQPGVAQIFYLFAQKFRGNGFGTESVNAFVNYFVKEQLAKNQKFLVQGYSLQALEMSALLENQASIKLIENHLKPSSMKEEERYGEKRKIYQIQY
ncbi:MAG: GNAT family N-acetyltransferase [Verrucomicrobia bacterium]|nr:GNAT family N-acetyltransferase [Verrucomicrobiota bacterium]